MSKEYISKDRVLEIIRFAYQTYLPAYHGPIAFIEACIKYETPLEEKE